MNPMYSADMNQSMLQIRLDTDDILAKIQTYLSGEIVYIRQLEDGSTKKETESIGRPKVNEEGLQGIMSKLQGLLNPHVVQGNYIEEFFFTYIRYVHQKLAFGIVINCEDWGIKDAEIREIIHTIMFIIIPFFSRLIGNKERESYQHTFQTKENTVIRTGEEKKGGLFK